MNLFQTLLLSACLGSPLLGQIIYVNASAKPGGDGKSWSSAYASLSKALASAGAGSQVWVSQGRYTGGFVVPKGVSLLGGFHPGDRRPSQRDWLGAQTVLDGGGTMRVLLLGDKTLLDGFVIQNGNAGGDGGGGVLVKSVQAAIRNCLFRNNKNSGGRGAAFHNLKGNIILENSIFYKNIGFGHVIDFTSAKGFVRHILVYDNLSNGLHFHLGTTISISNSIFALNSGRGICHISSTDRPTIENNLLWNNKKGLYHYLGKDFQNIQDVNKLSYAQKNITGDPKLLSPTTFNFSLGKTSPALDSGKLGSGQGQAWDQNPRILDANLDASALPDIGPAEYSNVRLMVQGTPRPGGPLSLRLSGQKGLLPLLLLSAQPARLQVLPFGVLLLNPGNLIALPFPLNTTVSTTLPSSFPKGMGLSLQALALGGKGGNLSNLIDLCVGCR
jgi:hypothetical protein